MEELKIIIQHLRECVGECKLRLEKETDPSKHIYYKGMLAGFEAALEAALDQALDKL